MIDWKRYRLAGAAAGLLAVGGVAGGAVVANTRPSAAMAPTVVTPIARLAQGDGIVSVKGRVAEVFGDRFVVQDATGRTLVDGGRDAVVTPGSTVTVQGRFDNGQLHAAYLVDAAGKVLAVGGPPHRGPGRDGPKHGPGRGHGPDGPPPPPPADRDAPPPAGATPPAQN